MHLITENHSKLSKFGAMQLVFKTWAMWALKSEKICKMKGHIFV